MNNKSNKLFSKIYVEITNYCNLNCSFCSKDNRIKKEMSVEEFNIVLDKIKDYTDTIYLHIKGEPLMHSNIDKILESANNKNINVRITTNGTLLKNRFDILSNRKIKQINVSLHSENNKKDYFKEVFDTTKLLSNKTAIIYRIWINNNKNIISEIENYFNIDNLEEKLNENNNIKLSDNIYLDKDIEFIWPNSDNKEYSDSRCLGTKTHIGILSDGTVVPCCLDSSGLIKLGNIFENNMNDILNSELFKNIRDGFKNKKAIHPVCKHCIFRTRFK